VQYNSKVKDGELEVKSWSKENPFHGYESVVFGDI
jgi:hypothetical protein